MNYKATVSINFPLEDLSGAIEDAVEKALQKREKDEPAKVARDIRWFAKRLDYSEAHCYELVSEKKVPHFRVGRSIRFDEEAVEAWIAAGRPAMDDAQAEAAVADYLINKKPLGAQGSRV